MKILVFMASPNKQGNTAKLLECFLENIDGEITIINAYDSYIKPCIDCKYCYSHKGECAIKDDEMKDIYQSINESDTIIVASPMYFSGFPAPMKTIIDRTQVYWSEKFILKIRKEKNKKGILLMTAGCSGEDMFLPMKSGAKHFFYGMGCSSIDIIEICNTDNYVVEKNKEILNKIAKITQKLKNKNI